MVEILGVPFSTLSFEETVRQLTEALHEHTPHHIITANPEIIMIAQDNDTVMRMLHAADLVTPDGIGAVWASQFYGTKIHDRVTGAELSSALIEHCAQNGLRVYLLGAKPESNALAQEKLRAQYPGLVIGGRDGYFTAEQEADVVAQVREFAPHLLLVGLGMPRQELFISGQKQILQVPVSIGIGGVIDIFAGTVKRAPKLWQKLKVEWLYRLLSQPTRWRRQLVLPQFVLTVLSDKNKIRQK
ncbi:MAG: WecB/TagA/CpsF family glycosyltransferase [Tumebacillaceae bacterium]